MSYDKKLLENGWGARSLRICLDKHGIRKAVKITSLILFLVGIILITGYVCVDNVAQSRYPVRKGDVLVFERTDEEQDVKGDVIAYNAEGNGPVRIKRTATEERIKIKKVDNGLKYGFPLKVGMKWGGDDPKRKDNMYANYVESQEDVVVPAGVFAGCFKIVYATVPDTQTDWYCPGAGVIKSAYNHHGTLINEIVVLKRIIWN